MTSLPALTGDEIGGLFIAKIGLLEVIVRFYRHVKVNTSQGRNVVTKF